MDNLTHSSPFISVNNKLEMHKAENMIPTGTQGEFDKGSISAGEAKELPFSILWSMCVVGRVSEQIKRAG